MSIDELKVALYNKLLKTNVHELTNAEAGMMYWLSRDKATQNVLDSATGGSCGKK